MSLSRLLVVLLAVCSLNLAVAQDKSALTEKPAMPAVKSDPIRPSGKDDRASFYRYLRSKPAQQLQVNSDLDNTCYTMRTYVVQRDEQHSDSVHPVSYTTCQPSPKFEVKVTKKVAPATAHW